MDVRELKMVNEAEDSRFTDSVLNALQEHLSDVKKQIKKRAIELAMEDQQQKDQKVGLKYMTSALNEFAPGHKVPKTQPGLIERFFTIFSPLTVISTVLAIVFGVLGLWGSGAFGKINPDAAKLLEPKAYLDIAKIFAGAIVGSATASAISERKKPTS
jgi:hypothetical protein